MTAKSVALTSVIVIPQASCARGKPARCCVSRRLNRRFSISAGSARRQPAKVGWPGAARSEEHTSELQSPDHIVFPLLLEKKKTAQNAFCRGTGGSKSCQLARKVRTE